MPFEGIPHHMDEKLVQAAIDEAAASVYEGMSEAEKREVMNEIRTLHEYMAAIKKAKEDGE